MPISIRPPTTADLPTLLRFEQGVISAERPMDPTIKDGPIHYYDFNTMLTSPGYPPRRRRNRQHTDRRYPRRLRLRPHRALPVTISNIPIMPTAASCTSNPHTAAKASTNSSSTRSKTWARSRKVSPNFASTSTPPTTLAIRAYEKAGFAPYLINMRMGI